MHYTATGTPATDRTQIGLVLSKDPSAARDTADSLLQRDLYAAGRRRGRRGHDRRGISAGRHGMGTLPSHAPARQEVGIHAPVAQRGDQADPCRSAIRLQLADLLHVQGAAAGAEGSEDRLDRVVRQLRGEQEQSRCRRSTSSGAIRPGKRCSTREYWSARS